MLGRWAQRFLVVVVALCTALWIASIGPSGNARRAAHAARLARIVEPSKASVAAAGTVKQTEASTRTTARASRYEPARYFGGFGPNRTHRWMARTAGVENDNTLRALRTRATALRAAIAFAKGQVNQTSKMLEPAQENGVAPATNTSRERQFVTVFALNEKAADQEVKRMLKSLVALASCQLKLFVIVNARAKRIIAHFFNTAAIRGLKVIIHELDEPKFTKRILSLGINATAHHANIYGMVKHFVIDIFPMLHGEFVIMDIDMVFGADVCSELPQIPPNKWAMMPVHKGFKGAIVMEYVCSCFVLYRDADQLRSVGWTTTLLEEIPAAARTKTKYGDQTIFFEIKRIHTYKFAFLPMSWNLGKCFDYEEFFLGSTRPTTYQFYPAAYLKMRKVEMDPTIFWGAVHFNCLGAGEAPKDNWVFVMEYWDGYPLQNLGRLRSSLPAFSPHSIQVVDRAV